MENLNEPSPISENSILKESLNHTSNQPLNSIIHVDVASVNTFPLYLALSLYIISKSFSSSTPIINVFKGKFKSISGLLLKIAVLTSFLYQFLLYFLNSKFKIDKVSLELSQRFSEKYFVSYKQYTVDLCYVLTVCLQMSDVLFVSCVFFCISILSNVSSELKEFQALNSLLSIRNYICVISRLWAIARIPIYFYAYSLEHVFDEKYVLFAKLLVYSLEFGIASFFMFLSNIKNQKIKSKKFSAKLFTTSLFLYGFCKYVINFIDFPFKLTKDGLDIIVSFQTILHISLLIMISDVFFSSENLKVVQNIKNVDPFFNQVAELETVIEFEDSKKMLKIK